MRSVITIPSLQNSNDGARTFSYLLAERQMNSRPLRTTLLCLAVATFSAACQSKEAKHAALAAAIADTVDGGELESRMWRAIEARNWPKVDSMLADGFQSAHSDGMRDRAGEIALL